MTREEGKEFANALKNNYTIDFDKLPEFCDMAISALSENKGEWIADVDKWGDEVTTVNGYTCSKCGMFNSDKDNFCPNCGADMREIPEQTFGCAED